MGEREKMEDFLGKQTEKVKKKKVGFQCDEERKGER